MLLTFILASALLVGSTPEADFVTGIVDPYLRIQTALTRDAVGEVGPDAERIADEAKKLGSSGEKIRSAADELRRASDLKSSRSAFGRLSAAIIRYAESSKTDLGSDVNVAYCSMIDKQWLQKGEKIGNPYDANMRTCGEIKKSKKAGS